MLLGEMGPDILDVAWWSWNYFFGPKCVSQLCWVEFGLAYGCQRQDQWTSDQIRKFEAQSQLHSEGSPWQLCSRDIIPVGI